MKIVYIAGRFRGPTAWDIECNIREAEHVGLAVAQLGAAPLIPHSNTRYFHGTCTEQFWLDATMALLRKCDAVITVWNWIASTGACAEVAEAKALDLPVFHELPELEAWLEQGRFLAAKRAEEGLLDPFR